MPKQHNIDLTPTEAMIAAASSGLVAATAGKGGVGLGETTRARARNIKSGKITPALVKRMHDFFAQYTGQRPDGIVEGTAWHTAWQLHGGDAGKAWAASRIKELHAAEVDLSEGDDEDHIVVFKELFFDDPRVSSTADGLIWKPVLRTGYWKVGPNGKPLMVVDGHSEDQRNAIGMQDIVDNYNAGAVEHVTVPTNHDDKVEQNTGYIKALKIHRTDQGSYLMAGHDFTEPNVKGMVERGTIPNTSVGLEFDYVRKEDGKKFPVVLKHVALTHRPWINKLTPFGVAASDDIKYEVEALEFSEEMTSEHADEFKLSAWDEALTMDEIRDSITSSLDDADELVDVAHDRVLIKSGDKKYVALFSVKDGDVEIQKRDEWAEQANLEVSDNEPPAATPPTSDPPSNVPHQDTEDHEGDQVPDFNDNDKAELAELLGDDYADQLQAAATNPEYDAMVKKFKAKGLSDAQAAAFATQALKRKKASKPNMSDDVDKNPFVLSESPEFKAQQEETARLRAENDQLLADKRGRETDEFVGALKAVGFTEEAGCTEFLKEVRGVMLADRGEAAVLLSDEDGATATPITATQLLRRVFDKLPSDEKTGKLVVKFSEQASDPLRQHQKPPIDADTTDLSEKDPEAFEKQQDELYEKMYGKPAAAHAPTN